jgi:hypothetical protein
MVCPRKYYYEEVLHLTATRDDTAYLRMHRCVYGVLRWVVEETSAGRSVDPGVAASRLDDLWAEDGPKGHPYETLYRTAADQLVARAIAHTMGQRGRTSQPDWTLTLSHGRVTFTPDHVEIIDENGAVTVIVQRMRTGRPSSSESDKAIYGLYHAAAESEHPGAVPRVEIAYLSTETIEQLSGKPRTIASKVEKYERALIGILRGDFRATPDDFGCPRCAHYFICPSAEDA